MPSAKVLESKQAIVEALAERMKTATSGVLVDYKGINVAQDTDLRKQLREADVDYTVIKNTLTRFAVNKVGFEELEPLLKGTTSLATTTGDPIIPFRLVNEYCKKINGKFDIKGGFIEGKVASMDQIKEIAALPSKEALLSQVLGTFLAPISSLAVVLNQIAEKKAAETGEALPEAAAAEAETAEVTPEAETAETATAEAETGE